MEVPFDFLQHKAHYLNVLLVLMVSFHDVVHTPRLRRNKED